MNTGWTIKIERLRTQLRVGVHADELDPQPVSVTLRVRGASAACPASLAECIDYAPLCRWITEQWPRTAHVPLLESRINELVAFAFDLDDRIQEVHAELAKLRVSGFAGASVGIERCVSRPEFEAQRRHFAGQNLVAQKLTLVSSDSECDAHQPA